MMKVDILAFGAHPDDIELGCGGQLAKLISEGKTVAIVAARISPGQKKRLMLHKYWAFLQEKT